MSTYRYILPAPGNVEKTVHKLHESVVVPELKGNTRLTLDFSDVILFRSGVNSYLKFVVNWGDNSKQEVLEKNTGYSTGDLAEIAHTYSTRNFPKIKYTCRVDCLKDNLSFDTYLVTVVLQQSKAVNDKDEFRILESHIYSPDDKEVDNLSLVVERPSKKSVSNILVPKDKKEQKIKPCAPTTKKIYKPLLDLMSTGSADKIKPDHDNDRHYYIVSHRDDFLVPQERQDPVMKIVEAGDSRFDWSQDLEFHKHGALWITNNQPFVSDIPIPTGSGRTVSVRTNFFIDNSGSDELKGKLDGYVGFGWKHDDKGEFVDDPSRISNIKVNGYDIGIPSLVHDVTKSSYAASQIIKNIESGIPNISISSQHLRNGWNSIDIEIYTNPTIQRRTPVATTPPPGASIASLTPGMLVTDWTGYVSNLYITVFATFFNADKSVYIDGTGSDSGLCNYSKPSDKTYLIRTGIFPPYATLSYSTIDRGVSLSANNLLVPTSDPSPMGPVTIPNTNAYPLSTFALSLSAGIGNTGWRFSHWSGDVYDSLHPLDYAPAGTYQNAWLLSGNRKIVANFDPVIDIKVEPVDAIDYGVGVAGPVEVPSGTASRDQQLSTGYAATSSVEYGSLLTLSATPYINTDPVLAGDPSCSPTTLFKFTGWTGDVKGNIHPNTSHVNSWVAHIPRTIVANYTPIPGSVIFLMTDPYPVDVYAYECSEYALEIVVRGIGPFTYQWYKDNAILPGATDRIYNISSVQMSNSGIYHVIVTSRVDSVSSEQVALNVSAGTVPYFTVHPLDNYAEANNDATFTSFATGYGISYQWYKDGAVITGATKQMYNTTCSPSTTGTYFVRATNCTGYTDSLSAILSAREMCVYDGQLFECCNPGYALSGDNITTEAFDCIATEDYTGFIAGELKIGDIGPDGKPYTFGVEVGSTLLLDHYVDPIHEHQRPFFRSTPITQFSTINVIPTAVDPVLRLRDGSSSEFAGSTNLDHLILEDAPYDPTEVDKPTCNYIPEVLSNTHTTGVCSLSTQNNPLVAQDLVDHYLYEAKIGHNLQNEETAIVTTLYGGISAKTPLRKTHQPGESIIVNTCQVGIIPTTTTTTTTTSTTTSTSTSTTSTSTTTSTTTSTSTSTTSTSTTSSSTTTSTSTSTTSTSTTSTSTTSTSTSTTSTSTTSTSTTSTSTTSTSTSTTSTSTTSTSTTSTSTTSTSTSTTSTSTTSTSTTSTSTSTTSTSTTSTSTTSTSTSTTSTSTTSTSTSTTSTSTTSTSTSTTSTSTTSTSTTSTSTSTTSTSTTSTSTTSTSTSTTSTSTTSTTTSTTSTSTSTTSTTTTTTSTTTSTTTITTTLPPWNYSPTCSNWNSPLGTHKYRCAKTWRSGQGAFVASKSAPYADWWDHQWHRASGSTYSVTPRTSVPVHYNLFDTRCPGGHLRGDGPDPGGVARAAGPLDQSWGCNGIWDAGGSSCEANTWGACGYFGFVTGPHDGTGPNYGTAAYYRWLTLPPYDRKCLPYSRGWAPKITDQEMNTYNLTRCMSYTTVTRVWPNGTVTSWNACAWWENVCVYRLRTTIEGCYPWDEQRSNNITMSFITGTAFRNQTYTPGVSFTVYPGRNEPTIHNRLNLLEPYARGAKPGYKYSGGNRASVFCTEQKAIVDTFWLPSDPAIQNGIDDAITFYGSMWSNGGDFLGNRDVTPYSYWGNNSLTFKMQDDTVIVPGYTNDCPPGKTYTNRRPTKTVKITIKTTSNP